MTALRTRVSGNFFTLATLLRNGVRFWSVLLYPFRRHLHRDNRLTLRSGISITAANSEPLLHLFRETWVEGRYSIPNLSIGKGGVIMDVGAHVGTFTIWAATKNPSARVIAAEPSPETLKYLRSNIEVNRLSNVTVVEAACGGSEGAVDLFSRGPLACNTVYRSDNYGSSFAAAGRVAMVTLDRLFSDFAVQHCDLLKLDCEGAEYEILYSAARNTLDRIEAIAMEYHTGMNEHDPRRLAEYLQQIGFNVDIKAPLDEEGGYLIATRS